MTDDLAPTKPIEVLPDGRLKLTIYAQDGTFVEMACPDNEHNRRFIVWLRKFDRYGPVDDDAITSARREAARETGDRANASQKEGS